MNHTQELRDEHNYHKMVEYCLADIVKEYKWGQTVVTLKEHQKLCLQLNDLMKSNLDMYFYRVGMLSPTEIKAMVMRMDHTLLRQCFKTEVHKRIAYVLQFKMEFENIENALKGALSN